MRSIPWRYVESWNCNACGNCCIGYQVVLGFKEWINLVRTYGIGVTQPGVNKLFLGKKTDGTCIFLYRHLDNWLCGLQNKKPKACMLWPFKIHTRPKHGRANEALYEYGGNRLFVYVDPTCSGLRWGRPKPEFTKTTLREVVEIAAGLREKQCYSTARVTSGIHTFRSIGRKLI